MEEEELEFLALSDMSSHQDQTASNVTTTPEPETAQELRIQVSKKKSKIHNDKVGRLKRVSLRTNAKVNKSLKLIYGNENTGTETYVSVQIEDQVSKRRRIKNRDKHREKAFKKILPKRIHTHESNSHASRALVGEGSGISVQEALLDNVKTLRRTNICDPEDTQETCTENFHALEYVDRSGSFRNSVVPTRFKCHLCTKVYKSNISLKAHLIIHSKKYQCEVCGICCSSKSQLVIHYRTHTGEKPFACKFCLKRFTVRSNLDVHLRTHTLEKPYRCNKCSKAFAQLGGLNYHKTNSHNI